ncbi:MAG: LysR family transcriptional regulator [Variovorax sp.]|nr:LysR family transcriptional regulator [Variovorax sp.]
MTLTADPLTHADRLMRRLRLRHIELLAVLGQVPTMHAASLKLNLSQPAISKMLREIEEAFGSALFERSKSGVKPNAMGKVAVRRASVIRHELAATAQEIDLAQNGAGPLLRLGALSVTSVVPAAIVRLRRAVPGVIVHLREGPVDILIGRLLVGELDCVVGALAPGILSTSEMKHLAVQTISKERLCVVSAPDHELASGKRLTWATLHGSPWVLPPSETLVRQTFIAAHMQMGLIVPSATVESLSPVTLSALVRTDRQLLGLMRSEQMHGEQEHIGLVELPVRPVFPLPSLSLFRRKSVSDSAPLVDRFLLSLHAT